MTVLGIDPGIAITGVAVVKPVHSTFILQYCTAIITPPSSPFPERLGILYEKLQLVINTWKPDICSIEQLFFNTNVKTALIVGQARGVVQLAVTQHHIPIIEYTPLQVKMALTGYGRAEKTQIQQMVKQCFKLNTIITPDDAADAAAIALTHCFSYKYGVSVKNQA